MSVSWPFSAPTEMLNTKLNEEAEQMLEGMSLEQKVGQMIQPDIRYITPAELSEYHIGTVLSGGGAPPNEKISWGKLGVNTPRFVIESDATIVLPLILESLRN